MSIFKRVAAFRFFSLLAGAALAFAALAFSCSNLHDAGLRSEARSDAAADGQTVVQAGGSTGQVEAPAASSQFALQTVSGTIGASGIFPEGFFDESDADGEAASGKEAGADGTSKTLLPPSSLIGTTVGIKYTATAKHAGQDDIEATVAQSGGSVSYQVDLPFSSDSDVWTLYVYGRQSSSPNTILLGAVDTIAYGESSKDFSVTYISDPAISDAKGSISLAIPIDDASGIKSAVVYCGPVGGSLPGGKVVNVSSGKITDTISTLTPGAYNVKIVFYNATNGGGDALYAIKEVANVYANWASSMPYGNADYIASGGSGFATISSEMVADQKSVLENGIWLGGSGLTGTAASDDNSGTKFKPVATLQRAVQIANALAAADATKTYTINVQGDVDVGTSSTPAAQIASGAKIKIAGTNATTYYKVNGSAGSYKLTSSGADVAVQYIDFDGMGAILVSAGKVTMNDCKVQNGTSAVLGTAGGITVAAGAEFKSEQGLLVSACENSNASGGGGGFYSAGTLTLAGATITGCSATGTGGNGGAIYNEGKCFVYGSTAIGDKNASGHAEGATSKHSNSATNFGGGIYNSGELYLGYSSWTSESANVEAALTGGVYYNYAQIGGGIYNTESKTVRFASGNINNNGVSTGVTAGGGIFTRGTVIMSGGLIDGNYGCFGGGGVYVAGTGVLDVSGGTISNNSCATDSETTGTGGGVLTGGTFRLSAGTICDNTAYWGGGVCHGGGTASMSGGTISGNTAQSGAGVYMQKSMSAPTFTMTGGTVSGNTISASSGAGGGFNVQADSTLDIQGGFIKSNSNGYMGGGVISLGTLTMSGGEISGNSATLGGGVLVYSNEFSMSGGTIKENTASYGGGIFVFQQNVTVSGVTTLFKGQLNLGGDAVIPAGSDGKNDIFLQNILGDDYSKNAITITENLTAANVATITPYGFATFVQVLDGTAALVSANCDKFAVTPQPAKTWYVTDTGYLGAVTYIGSKAPGSTLAVGDIVFSDGSAEPYSESLTLTDTQKAAAVAVIFYTEPVGEIDLGTKSLGVGLKQTKVAWSSSSVSTYEVKLPLSMDDGSGNWAVIETADPTGSASPATNYPAFNWCDTYGVKVRGSSSGWYLPAYTELRPLKIAFDAVNNSINKIGTGDDVVALGKYNHWASSQDDNDTVAKNYALTFHLNGGGGNQNKNAELYVRAVRVF